MLSSFSSKYIGRVHSISTIWQQHRHTYTTICIEKNVSHTVFPMHLKMCFNVYMRLPTSSSALLLSAMTSQMDILYNHNDDEDPIHNQPTWLAIRNVQQSMSSSTEMMSPRPHWAFALKSFKKVPCTTALCQRDIKCQ